MTLQNNMRIVKVHWRNQQLATSYTCIFVTLRLVFPRDFLLAFGLSYTMLQVDMVVFRDYIEGITERKIIKHLKFPTYVSFSSKNKPTHK